MPEIEVSIIIVSYNTRELTENCLSSIFANAGKCRHEVILIDNNSSDGSPEMVSSEFPSVRLIHSGYNAGFGKANNIGLKQARGEYVLFLNSDTEALPGSIENLMAFARKRKDAGVVAGRLYGDKQKNLQITCSTFPTTLVLLTQYSFLRKTKVGQKMVLNAHWLKDWDRSDSRPVQAVSGACMLIKTEVAKRVGGFDERFFMYFEDIDLSKVIADMGYRNYYCHTGEFIHYSGQSSKKSSGLGIIYKKSMRYYISKHYGIYSLAFFRVMQTILKPLSPLQKVYAALLHQNH